MEKVFEFKGEETDWIAASSKSEAIRFYSGLTGMTHMEIRETYSIRELTDKEMDEMTVEDIDSEELSDGSDPILWTFRKMAQECANPSRIASTAY